MVVNQSLNINQIVKDPEHTGRDGFSLILSNVTNKAKNNQPSFMNLHNNSIIIVVQDTILNKFEVSGLACATRKAAHQKQNP